MTILSETRERLLRAIVMQVPAERIAEIHFFSPIKQGGVESGVAVIAAVPERAPVVADEMNSHVEAIDDAETVDPEAVENAGEEAAADEDDTDEIADVVDEIPGEAITPKAESSERHVVYTARYRLTLKGPDRGKWETNIVAEADAPLITVDVVVRGVQRRVGELDEPERMTGEEVRAALAPRGTDAIPFVPASASAPAE